MGTFNDIFIGTWKKLSYILFYHQLYFVMALEKVQNSTISGGGWESKPIDLWANEAKMHQVLVLFGSWKECILTFCFFDCLFSLHWAFLAFVYANDCVSTISVSYTHLTLPTICSV